MKTDNVGSEAEALPFWQRTFSSLRYRDFRLVWLGSCTEHVGQYMEIMAMAWLMKELTESPYYLGLPGSLLFGTSGGGWHSSHK